MPFPLFKLISTTSPPSVAVAENTISTALTEVAKICDRGLPEDVTTTLCPLSKNLGTLTSREISPGFGVGVGVTVGVGVGVGVNVCVGVGVGTGGGRGGGIGVEVKVGVGAGGGASLTEKYTVL